MNVVVIGAGAAGMMAAIIAASEKNKVTIVEKMPSAGSKLKITGKGRCNITFDGDKADFEKNIVKNAKFMRNCFFEFDNKDTVKFFNDLGLETKIERGGRVFPLSDKAEDVIKALLKKLKKLNVKILYNSKVKDIALKNGRVDSVILSDDTKILCDKCILATGGKSYSSTGSTGDGYIIAKKHGHSINPVVGGLVPLKCYGDICQNLQGLTIKNISLNLIENNTKVLYNDFR